MHGEVLVDGGCLGGVVEVVIPGRHQERLDPRQTGAEVGMDEDGVKGHERQVNADRGG